MLTHASAMPSGMLARPISTLSVSSWRRIRARPAPSAVRIEISRMRADARASIRFATLKQAIRRIRVTAPIIAASTVRTFSGTNA